MVAYVRAIAHRLSRSLSSEQGAGIAEYVMLVGFIAVVIIGVVIGFRGMLGGALTDAGQSLQNFR